MLTPFGVGVSKFVWVLGRPFLTIDSTHVSSFYKLNACHLLAIMLFNLISNIMKKIFVLMVLCTLSMSVSAQEVDSLQSNPISIDSLAVKLEKLQHDYDFLKCDYELNKMQFKLEILANIGIFMKALKSKQVNILTDCSAKESENTTTQPTMVVYFTKNGDTVWDIAKKYNEHKVVIDSIASHHGDKDAQSVIAVLVAVADALSASRPGARNDSLENYLKRLEQLENVANEIPGIDHTFAVQAGRELKTGNDELKGYENYYFCYQGLSQYKGL